MRKKYKPVLGYIEKAWAVFRKNFWDVIKANLLIFFIPAAFVIVGILPFFSILAPIIKESVVPEPEIIAELIVSSGINNILFLGFMLLLAVVSSIVLKAGIIKMYAEMLKGKSRINVLFETAKEKFWTILCANVFVLVLSFLIMGLLFVPLSFAPEYIGSYLNPIGGVLIMLVQIFFIFVNQSIVIRNKRALESVKESFGFSKANFLRVLVIFGLFMAASLGLSLADQYATGFIGSLATALVVSPVFLIALTHFYIMKGR